MWQHMFCVSVMRAVWRRELTCLYELFWSQRPRKSPPAVMSSSRETPCICTTPWSTFLMQILMVLQILKKFTPCMKPSGPMQC